MDRGSQQCEWLLSQVLLHSVILASAEGVRSLSGTAAYVSSELSGWVTECLYQNANVTHLHLISFNPVSGRPSGGSGQHKTVSRMDHRCCLHGGCPQGCRSNRLQGLALCQCGHSWCIWGGPPIWYNLSHLLALKRPDYYNIDYGSWSEMCYYWCQVSTVSLLPFATGMMFR